MENEYIYQDQIIDVFDLYNKMCILKKKKAEQSIFYNKLRQSLCEDVLSKYLFIRPVKNVYSLNDLITNKYFEHDVLTIYDINIYRKIGYYKQEYDKLAKYRRQYWSLYKKYCKLNNIFSDLSEELIKSYPENTKKEQYMKEHLQKLCSQLFGRKEYNLKNKKPSVGETLIMNFLDKIAIEYNLI